MKAEKRDITRQGSLLVHPETVESGKKINPKIIRFFEILSNENRLRMLVKISEGPIRVTELHKSMNGAMTLSGLSHQLRSLEDLDMIIVEKKGREKYCRLSDDFCWCILKDAFRHFDSKKKCPNCCNGLK